ncbi:hypothetical protein RMS29_001545 [Agrobacterium rosae]|uniref:Tail fiber protein n=1 Tax=Agrobacterium rosae TaxID=1972867 RepID=A0ABU4VVS1_9HYPH|nr:hypothetical protein [Agrobacterium rosae]MDX8329604.1 hypothetical protein [Agrobacterium rosae]
MVERANIIFSNGPSDNPDHPDKTKLRAWGTWLESFITAIGANSGSVYPTRAALFADLARPANAMAWVVDDDNVAYNGIYAKSGAIGAGAWSRLGDLPISFIVGTDIGAGTANAIKAETVYPVSESALIIVNVFRANTSANVTISFNGGAALAVKTSAGNNPSVGGLPAGMRMLGIVSGATFRLVSDQASAAVLAAAETAATAAANSATAAAGSATTANTRATAAATSATGAANSATAASNSATAAANSATAASGSKDAAASSVTAAATSETNAAASKDAAAASATAAAGSANTANTRATAAATSATAAANSATAASGSATAAANSATASASSATAAQASADAAAAVVSGGIGEAIHGATAKSPMADADEFGLSDSADGWKLKRITLAQLVARIFNTGRKIANGYFLTSFRLWDATTNTKGLAFDLSAISAATTRTLKMPDGDVDLSNVRASSVFTSANQTYTVSGLGSVAHGLGAQPSWISAQLICVTASNNWLVSDWFDVASSMQPWSGQGSFGLHFWANGTTINWKVGGNGIGILNKSSGGSEVAPSSNWVLRFKAGL